MPSDIVPSADPSSTDPTAVFLAHRPRLHALAYRMLGARDETEDVLQEAWLRWHAAGAPAGELRSVEAWLVTVVTRLCLDRLRALKLERAGYPGPWLPEPLTVQVLPCPAAAVEQADAVSIALLTVLERLAPEERAAFLLREVFELDYPALAQMLGKSEAASRQLVHRAKARVREERPRHRVAPAVHAGLLARFAAAARDGAQAQLLALFADDVTLTADGGGKVQSVLRVLRGAGRIARFYGVIARRMGGRFDHRPVLVNGEPGLLRTLDGRPDALITADCDGARIHAIYVLRNPDKLAALAGR